MSRELDKFRAGRIARKDNDGEDRTNMPVPLSTPSGFFTFRYSSTEVFSQGGNLHVKMKENLSGRAPEVGRMRRHARPASLRSHGERGAGLFPESGGGLFAAVVCAAFIA